MHGREPDFWTTIVAISAIAFMVSAACYCGIDDTLVKIGIAAIAGLAGFSLHSLIRKP